MKTACITGASSGIGRELAVALSNNGYRLILVARNSQALYELAKKLKTRCLVIPCDLANEEACMELAKKLSTYRIDILINNAGFGDIGNFHETKLETDLDMIDVNIKATHILTKELLPRFIKRNSGYIMNVASSAGLLPGGPYMATYYATKSYVVSLTGAIYHELKAQGSKVHICALCPGPVDTNFNNVAHVKFTLPGITAKACARYALKCMFKKKLIIIPTKTMKLASHSARFVPRKLMLAMTAKQQVKKMG
ncbi:MAG: SDR family oxidoreductase [Lachnospira sp.]|nr:SDR family oxidoreductase [Lachnospira sp.]